MKKLLGILVLGLFLVGCETTGPLITDYPTAEEFERNMMARGYIYTARAQSRSSINAYGLGITGRPASGASKFSQQEANATATSFC